jgi:hypothetical protein
VTGGGGANVGTAIPGGGAATANGSSINSTGSSGSCSWKGEAVGALGVTGAAAVVVGAGGAVAVLAPSWGLGAEFGDGALWAGVFATAGAASTVTG